VVNLQATPMDELCSLRIFAKIDDVMVGLMKELALPIPEWHLQRLLKLEVAPMLRRADLRTLTVSAMDVDGICATVFKAPRLRNNGRRVMETKMREKGRVREKRQSKAKPKGMKRGAIMKCTDSMKRRLHEEAADVFVFNIPSELEMKAEHTEKEKKDEIQGAQGGEKAVKSPAQGRPSENVSVSPNSADEAREEKKEETDPDGESGLVLNLGFFGHYGEPRLDILLNGPLSGLGEDGGVVVCRLTMDIASKQWAVELIDDFVPLPVVKDTYCFTVQESKE